MVALKILQIPADTRVPSPFLAESVRGVCGGRVDILKRYSWRRNGRVSVAVGVASIWRAALAGNGSASCTRDVVTDVWRGGGASWKRGRGGRLVVCCGSGGATARTCRGMCVERPGPWARAPALSRCHPRRCLQGDSGLYSRGVSLQGGPCLPIRGQGERRPEALAGG